MDAAGGRLIRLRARGEARPARAEALLAALPTALLMVGSDGTILDANGAAEALLNLARHAVIGMGIADAIGHDLRSMPADTPFVAYDLDLILPGGRHIQANLSAAPLPDWPGWRVVTVHALPAMAPIARGAGRQGGGLTAAGAAAVLAHEIKNPLSGIRGAAQLLERDDEPETLALTRLIRDEVDRIAALIDRMEHFADRRPLALEPQNIHAILDHALTVFRRGSDGGGQIREAYDPSLPPVLGHRDSLVQVLLNLLGNAAEAAGGGGLITLTTAYRHGLRMVTRDGAGRRSLPIEVCVVDDGPGAPVEIAQHLFEPFVSSKRAGRGLGLAVVEKLVADMGGLVEYARETRDGRERTVFRLLLARAKGDM